MNKNVDGRARTTSLVVLLIVNIIVFSIVIIAPHDEGDRKGTIPDEYAFYAWSEMYMDGKLDIPINELTTHSTAVMIAMPYASPLDVAAASFSNGTDGIEDDIQVAVEFKDHTPVIDALVFISGRDKPAITDDDGEAVIENYRLPSGEIIARYEDDSGNFFGSTVFNRRLSGQMNYNTYITTDIRTVDLKELDTSSPVSILIDVPVGAPVPPPNGNPIREIEQQVPPGGDMEEGDELFHPVELQWTLPLLLLSLVHVLICGMYLAWKGPRKDHIGEE